MEKSIIPQFRIAPTPSGYLHLGNLYNFMLTAIECKRTDGLLHLRLDDIDHTRVRAEFVQDIFETLDWLGFVYDCGPTGPDDFTKNYSQPKKRDLYEAHLKNIANQFVCECSRKAINESTTDGHYPGTCHNNQRLFEIHKTCIRFKTSISFKFQSLCPHELMRDFIIWSKEDLPSYQLVSVVEDFQNKITHIIRGEDLAPSSAAQCELAYSLGIGPHFDQIKWHHHSLLCGEHGLKLSKSKSDLGLKTMRESGMSSAQVWQLLAKNLNLNDPMSFEKLSDFNLLPNLYKHP